MSKQLKQLLQNVCLFGLFQLHTQPAT